MNDENNGQGKEATETDGPTGGVKSPRIDLGRPDRVGPKIERPQADKQASLAFAAAVAREATALRCEDVVVLDVSLSSPVTDFVVIGSGTSDRQMRSVIESFEEMGEKAGFPPARTNKDERALWLLADFVDVVVHLFEPNTRAHYDLETLWGESEAVDWESIAPATRDQN